MADSFEAVALRVEAGADAAAASISELSREVAYGATREVVRNAARHARGDAPDRPLHVEVIVENGQELSVTVADDGVGLANGGAEGSGLALHATMMAVIGGSLNVESEPGSGTRATVAVPLTSYP